VFDLADVVYVFGVISAKEGQVTFAKLEALGLPKLVILYTILP
jgi:hypothetical protein